MEKLYQDRDWLYNQYITLGKSASEIAEECECSKQTILSWLIKFGIERRSLNEAWKQKYKNGYINPFKDKHHTPESRKLISETRKQKFENGYIHPMCGNPREDMKNDKNPNWKGDEAGVIPIHNYIRIRKSKPEDGKCELCSKVMDEKEKTELELSFLDHIKKYTRNPEDYQYAHHSCHLHYDKEQRFLKRNKTYSNLN